MRVEEEGGLALSLTVGQGKVAPGRGVSNLGVGLAPRIEGTKWF